ncbi:IS256 family transposase [Clostridium cochlearium]|uniref:IS256 family transposase n=1 Tax=Clostridium cochlearium TaxID=1494 RepID=UPI000BBCEF10|nr:IS256 family transposase [Clostridium cochlearium]
MLKKELLREFIRENNLTTARELQLALKDLFAGTLQEMLEAELEDYLGYSKYDYKNKSTKNSRNGSSPKKIISDFGEVDIAIPRDRQGEFEPKAVKKYENDISGIEDKVLGMYAKGMTTRDISAHLEEIYGVDVSPTLISRITDKITPIAQEWQSRPLDSVYPIIFLDAIHYKVRSDGKVINKAAYIIIGVTMQGYKEVLGIWVGENESAKYWLSVLTDLKNRGVKDIFIASIDGLTGFKDAIKAIYPNTEIQRCVIHQIRNSTKYIPWKDRKEFCHDLKLVYSASTEEMALIELDKLKSKWNDSYSIAINSWVNNWEDLSTYFRYPEEIRKLIYTTNSMESYNRQLRKVTKSKSIFPTDDSLLKMLYLATQDITKKWTQNIRNWALVLAQLSIHFEERFDSTAI